MHDGGVSDWPPPRDEVRRSFDARAATYDSSDMHRWVAAATAEALAPDEGARVIDAAAGTALAGRWLLARDPSIRVLAVDLAPQLLAAGRRQADDRLWPVQADAAVLPVRRGSVDGVCALPQWPTCQIPARSSRSSAALYGGEGDLPCRCGRQTVFLSLHSSVALWGRSESG